MYITKLTTGWIAILCYAILVKGFRIVPPNSIRRRLFMIENSAGQRDVKFGQIRISGNLANCLGKKNIIMPNGIQITALAPVESGISCILHAATGTGKTLCFSLPVMSKLQKLKREELKPMQTLVVVPSKELSYQVAADFASLESDSGSSLVQLFATSNSTKESIFGPIVVTTAYKLLDVLQSLPKEQIRSLLSNIDTLILDEVDRLLPTLSKYATYADQRKAHEFVNPTQDLIYLLHKARATVSGSHPPGAMQVIACSATVGRPLRRELCRLFPPENDNPKLPISQQDNYFPIIRPPELGVSPASDGEDEQDFFEPEQHKISRLIGIPKSIIHQIIIDNRASDEGKSSLACKLGILKDFWAEDDTLKRGILFVPKTTDVEQAATLLRIWGQSCITDLSKVNLHDFTKRNVLKRPNKTHGTLAGAAVSSNSTETTEALEKNENLRTQRKKPLSKTIVVLPISASRGLHIPDIDCVMLCELPKSMDEYLHAAGRTARLGSTRQGSSVVCTVVTDEQEKALQGWKTPLGIDFVPIYF